MNMDNTKLIVSGSNLDVLKKYVEYLCVVCQTGVGSVVPLNNGCTRNVVV